MNNKNSLMLCAVQQFKYLFVFVYSYTGIPSEGDAGNSFPSYLAGWVYSRPRH